MSMISLYFMDLLNAVFSFDTARVVAIVRLFNKYLWELVTSSSRMMNSDRGPQSRSELISLFCSFRRK